MAKTQKQMNITADGVFEEENTKSLNDMSNSKITLDMMDEETRDGIEILRAITLQRTMFDALAYKHQISTEMTDKVYEAFDDLQEQISEVIKDSFDRNILASMMYQQQE